MKLYSIILPYFLLVSFYTPQINQFDIKKINAINHSPYYGVAVPLIGPYDAKIYSEKDFRDAVELIKINLRKDLWPWVFFNRFTGYQEGKLTHSPLAKGKYFQNIKVIDIYDQSGALTDFYNIWRMALRMAKELHSPGIVVDHEPYNNYAVDNLAYVAQQLGKSEEDIKKRLHALGADLIDLADQEYPGATLWFFATGLGRTKRSLNPLTPKEYRRLASYIIHGMLERAKEKKSTLKIVSGGEIGLGLCHLNLNDLKETIKQRNKDFTPALSQLPNLYLGGIIAPWAKAEARQQWMLEKKCGKSQLKTLDDFKPLIAELARSYKYVWIYAASAAGYDPYSGDPIFNTILTK